MQKTDSALVQSGASMIELIIATPILMLLGLGTVQAGLLYHAKSTLNYATFEAARKGSVKNAKKSEMKKELGIRLGPVFGATGEAEDALRAMMMSAIDVKDPRFTNMEIINPTAEAFDDWGVANPDNGMLEIPNSHLRQRHSERVPGATSGVSLQDANLLKIEVTYGYQLSVPIVDKIFTRAMRLIDPGNMHFYTARRMPLKSVATVRMQSPAQRDNNLHFAANNLVGTADPTTATTAAVASTSTCDPHGISEDLDANILDDFFPADDTALTCSTTVETIGGLYENGGTGGVTGQSSVSDGSFTDCT